MNVSNKVKSNLKNDELHEFSTPFLTALYDVPAAGYHEPKYTAISGIPT